MSQDSQANQSSAKSKKPMPSRYQSKLSEAELATRESGWNKVQPQISTAIQSALPSSNFTEAGQTACSEALSRACKLQFKHAWRKNPEAMTPTVTIPTCTATDTGTEMTWKLTLGSNTKDYTSVFDPSVENPRWNTTSKGQSQRTRTNRKAGKTGGSDSQMRSTAPSSSA
jgi:hypothetical protein